MREVTSRGVKEELWFSVKHALHAEGHLEEMISQVAVTGDTQQIRLLMQLLDDTRRQRQQLVQIAFTGESPQPPAGFRARLDSYWCAIKHLLLLEGHLEEAIANAARARDLTTITRLGKELHSVSNKRRLMIDTIMGKVGRYQQTPGCLRCKGDLRS